MPSVRPRLPARHWSRALTFSCLVSIVGTIAVAGADATAHHARSLGPAVNGRIAFSSGGDNDSGNLEIHTVGPNGTGETRLTKHGPSGEVVGWSAGGRKIVIWPGSLWTLNP